MYRYKVKLYPELAKMRAGVNLCDYRDIIDKTVKEFNAASVIAANKKSIEDGTVSVATDYIELIIYSENWMEFPTKGLRGFIVRLSKVEPFKSMITENGRLFRGESEFLEDKNAEETSQVAELTDEEMMIELVKIFNRKSTENEKIKNQIREILSRRA